ncbi:hypothetical protein ACLOJK_000864 [Asimina triloba]
MECPAKFYPYLAIDPTEENRRAKTYSSQYREHSNNNSGGAHVSVKSRPEKKWFDVKEEENWKRLHSLLIYLDQPYLHEAYNRVVRKEYYDHHCTIIECGTNPELHPPHGVEDVLIWGLLSISQHKSKVNKKNRLKQEYTHFMGPKPFMVVLSEQATGHVRQVERTCLSDWMV